MTSSRVLVLVGLGAFAALACSGSGDTGTGGGLGGGRDGAADSAVGGSRSGKGGASGGSAGAAAASGRGGASGSGGASNSGGVGGSAASNAGGSAASNAGGASGSGGDAGSAGGAGGTGASGGAGGTGASGGAGGRDASTGPDASRGAGGSTRDAGPRDGSVGLPCSTTKDCEDHNPCNGTERCAEGTCVAGVALSCNDGNACTTDSCVRATGCVHAPLNGGTCSDGNACTANDTCQGGTCSGTSPTVCNDLNPCTDDTCSTATGCVFTNNTLPCNDGNACTANDVCTGGTCTGAQAVCNDNDPCTTDTCNPPSGCAFAPASGGSCDDGNPCTTGDTCTSGVCAGPGAKDCGDSNECTADSCASDGTCLHQALGDGVPCSNDGNVCTVDTCQGGACHTPVPAGTVPCRAATCSGTAPGASAIVGAFCGATGSCPAQTTLSCGTDPCNIAGSACQGSCGLDTDCPGGFFCNALGKCSAMLPNGDACTRSAQCAQTHCVDGFCCDTACGGGVTTDCQACNVTAGTCSPLSGPACSDGNPCTAGESCGIGSCGGGGPTNCNDQNPCTADSCDPVTGCKHVAVSDGTACNDGNACTPTDTCTAGVCGGAGAKNCDDGNVCTLDGCSPATGCTHVNNSAPCSDGNACTAGDTCSAGTCQGSAVNCDDGVFCNGVETCSPATGCGPGAGVVCGNTDGLDCTVEFCNEGKKSCDAALQDVRCNDKVFCNGIETCVPSNPAHDVNGCIAGSAPTCDDGIPCTTNGCSNATSACTFVPVDAACQNGTVCDGVETCSAQTGCVAGTALQCDDGKFCTVDTCNPVSGCAYTPNDGRCQDGLYCDGAESCVPASIAADAKGCISGTAVFCPSTDAVPCTQDVCDEPTDTCKVSYNDTLCSGGLACTAQGCGKSCTSSADCNDGLGCNGVETCDLAGGSPGKCKAGIPVVCNDGRSCTSDSCQDPAGTCVYAPNNAACNDGDACTTESCNPGAVGADAVSGCLAGPPVPYDDGYACTFDSCSPSAGPVHSPQNFLCDDAIFCNGKETCNTAVGAKPSGCVAGSPVVCTPPPPPAGKTACVTSKCDETTAGCVNTADDSKCVDGTGTKICGQTCSITNGCGINCTIATCQGKVYQCGDCVDNDGHCDIDTADPECLGPCSDNESGFMGNIPGQDHGNCDTDCYFDQDNGSGNDQCFWSEACDPRSIAANNYTPTLSNKCDFSKNSPSATTQCNTWFNAQSASCWSPGGTPPATNYCGALVPNGCDCFGCCVIPGAPTPVFLGSRPTNNSAGTCALSTVSDPTLCHPCTQVPSCLNTCAHCEICIGKPTLPADCGTCQTCPAGALLCNNTECASNQTCPAGQFCNSGCCALNP